MDSNQVLIDARVKGIDGIGRYTYNLVRALLALLPCLGIDALELLLRSNELQQYSSSCQFDISEHSTHAELQYLADAAKQTTALLLHCTDYRVPLHALKMPLVVSVHDSFRYTNPALCYGDTEFKDRYGTARFGDVCRIVDELDVQDLHARGRGSYFGASGMACSNGCESDSQYIASGRSYRASSSHSARASHQDRGNVRVASFFSQ